MSVRGQELAPEGQTWVCPFCGRNNIDRCKVGDESCVLRSVLCRAETDENGEQRFVKVGQP